MCRKSCAGGGEPGGGAGAGVGWEVAAAAVDDVIGGLGARTAVSLLVVVEGPAASGANAGDEGAEGGVVGVVREVGVGLSVMDGPVQVTPPKPSWMCEILWGM